MRSGPLTFQDPDLQRFPALRIAKDALSAGGRAPAAMNAANERAVAAFLDRRITFLDIPNVVAETLERMHRTMSAIDADPLESARTTDAEARRVADDVVGGRVAA